MVLQCKSIFYFREIYNFSGFSIDEKIIEVAVQNNCHLFLDEVWNGNHTFGNFKTSFGPQISFIHYIKPMITFNKIEMASEAIKFWENVYKEEGVFDYLLENKQEELMM